MGAIDASVELTLALLPEKALLAGIFLASCFISMSIGTSVGTIVALTPVTAGLATETGMSTPLIVAAAVGGALFGDNLSFISDTTVVATRTQGVRMSDKFKTNFRIVLPAAIITTILYVIMGLNATPNNHTTEFTFTQIINVIPYLAVILLAILGKDVLLVLLIGNLFTGLIGMITGAFDASGWFGAMASGIGGMGELILISMIAGGLLELIRKNGGITFLIHWLTRRVRNSRGAEFSIGTLVGLTNLCTANNTIAILSVGEISRNIAERYGVDPKRSASILDTCSCIVQGFIPYGAQLLMAAGLASISPVEIIPHLFYPMLLIIAVVISISVRGRFETTR
jgi:Na+/H+ antiporter NhaC